ncbi:F0F1 ATP synthase subunit delta [Bacillaceae bacterium SIJ1]|uniref:F0F1 ATP synthase subunit delta n=1 Tax=Litoribacterium kuwaitense TaxID=1398745 RepID=UPI0013EB2A4E|nr:F0F1 ATP synthase subunit delta [Litoribacterium kuwaitense]NGP44735.1 F0F1 ATP synthase subunit delta [Litoribacterium kuwaitense]
MSTVAARYASALFEIAKEKQSIEAIREDVKAVEDVFSADDIQSFFLHPNVSKDEKKRLIDTGFTNVAPEVKNTLHLMIERQRTLDIPHLSEAFNQEADAFLNTGEAVVYSVRPLTEAELQQVAEVFSQKAGKASLRVKNETDPSLIAGIRVRIGNRIYDGSVSRQLEKIERQLVSK